MTYRNDLEVDLEGSRAMFNDDPGMSEAIQNDPKIIKIGPLFF